MKQKRLNRLLMLLVAFITMSINLWAEDVTSTISFSSTTPSGWTNSSTTAGASGYAKMKSGNYVEISAESLFGSGQVLSSDFKANVSCGTFGTWSGTKSVTIKVALLNSSNGEIASASYTKSSLGSSEGTYVASDYPLTITKPDDISQISKIRVTFTIPNANDVLRFKNLKLNYSTQSTSGGDPDPGTGGSGEWTKVTSLSEITTGYKYLIVSNGATKYMMSSSVVSNRFSNGAEATISGNTVTNATIAENCQWEIIKSGDYYYIKQDSKYAGGTTTKNQGAMIATQTDLTKWTVTVDGGVFDFVNYGRSQQSTDNANKYLRSNTTNGWACYTTGTGAKCMLFRQASGAEPVCEVAPVIGSIK